MDTQLWGNSHCKGERRLYNKKWDKEKNKMQFLIIRMSDNRCILREFS